MKTTIRISSLLVAVLISVVSQAADELLVQSTTSTANSGLYDYLLPEFEAQTGIRIHVVAVGTGQAIRNARNCDADVLLVHAKSAEQQFIADGYGIQRFDLMYNDFIIVGPPSDPAAIRGDKSVVEAIRKIAQSKSRFASRGDNSGTHTKEMMLWQAAAIDPVLASGQWYRETGSGMGATLMAGVGMNAYVMTDRATWISFSSKADFEVLVAGDDVLFNQYGVMIVNPEKCPHVRLESAQVFVDWLLSKKGQSLIAEFEVAGQQLFFPNARLPNSTQPESNSD